jgi:hypothetical protein
MRWLNQQPRLRAFVLVLLFGVGCNASDDDADGTSDGAHAHAITDPPKATGAGSKAASAFATRCGVSSSCGPADLVAARAHFVAARYAEAFEEYKCGNTAEAAFGAGVSKLLNALESKAADQVLADLGQPHFASAALLGPDSYLSRAGKRWNGKGQLSLRGARTLDVTFARARAGLDEDEIRTDVDKDGTRVEVSIGLTHLSGMGTLPIAFNCMTGTASGIDVPRVMVTLRDDTHDFECSIPFAVNTSQCMTDAGRLNVVAGGVNAGELVHYALENVRLECVDYAEDGDSEASGGQPMIVTASGEFEATISEHVDLSDLHPLFDHVSVAQVVSAVTLAEFVNHAAPIADDLAQAACFLDRAAAEKRTGTVYSLPGASFAGDDLPFNAGDAGVLASLATSAAGLLQLARAFPISVPLRDIACAIDDYETTGCPTEAAFVQHVNAAVAKVAVAAEPLDAARYLIELALLQFDHAASAIDEHSVFMRDAESASGWDLAQEYVRAAATSLRAGKTALPRVTPQVTFDLRAFFGSPPDPRAVQVPLIVSQEECDDPTECVTDSELNLDYVDAFLDDVDVDWRDGEYEFDQSAEDVADPLFQELFGGLRDHGFMLGE